MCKRYKDYFKPKPYDILGKVAIRVFGCRCPDQQVEEDYDDYEDYLRQFSVAEKCIS